jgi:hypothetical protein
MSAMALPSANWIPIGHSCSRASDDYWMIVGFGLGVDTLRCEWLGDESMELLWRVL